MGDEGEVRAVRAQRRRSRVNRDVVRGDSTWRQSVTWRMGEMFLVEEIGFSLFNGQGVQCGQGIEKSSALGLRDWDVQTARALWPMSGSS